MKRRTVNVSMVRIAGPTGGMILSRLLGLTKAGGRFDDLVHEGELTWVRRTPEEFAFELGLVTRDGEPRIEIVCTQLDKLIAARLVHRRLDPLGDLYTLNKPALIAALDKLTPTPHDTTAPGTVWAMRAEIERRGRP